VQESRLGTCITPPVSMGKDIDGDIDFRKFGDAEEKT
jgi:hypothetical protein